MPQVGSQKERKLWILRERPSGGEVEAGRTHKRFALDEEDQMRMYLDWQWLTGDRSSGRSEWILT